MVFLTENERGSFFHIRTASLCTDSLHVETSTKLKLALRITFSTATGMWDVLCRSGLACATGSGNLVSDNVESSSSSSSTSTGDGPVIFMPARATDDVLLALIEPIAPVNVSNVMEAARPRRDFLAILDASSSSEVCRASTGTFSSSSSETASLETRLSLSELEGDG